jgi:hypothetical protein
MDRRYELSCNGRMPHADPETALFQGDRGVTLARVRAHAAKAGWTHVRSPSGRRYDRDYCPDHKPEATQ